MKSMQAALDVCFRDWRHERDSKARKAWNHWTFTQWCLGKSGRRAGGKNRFKHNPARGHDDSVTTTLENVQASIYSRSLSCNFLTYSYGQEWEMCAEDTKRESLNSLKSKLCRLIKQSILLETSAETGKEIFKEDWLNVWWFCLWGKSWQK